ncbi:YdcF family protein [Spirulina sp. 06S082]|uniref:YdcF family protein n=1 Tax=Spirulina sp. 06S082 TaxID=3110248 RepID=UPI002B1FD604|nr:YdcF family protein [Spirulina sp. 06S082]MEA5468805.1 YdcF family protein [Spirulina sp. 06S082]
MVLKLTSRQFFPSTTSCQQSKRRSFFWLVPALIVALFFAYKELQSILVQPNDVFVLGGLEKREWEAAELAKDNPQLEIWVSSGSPEGYVRGVFDKAGIESDRVHLDYTAQDTVTNFTTSVDRLQMAGVESVYLVTSKNHMRRARIVGEIVFGSRGIILKPMVVESEGKPEPLSKTVRDGGRAFLWLLTGKTAVSLKDKVD